MGAVEEQQPVALVVEDDEQIAFLLRFILEREGLQVRLAKDGKEARELIGSLPPPALVTLDVMLPYADGFQLLGEIRGKAGWQALPVLMLTSKSQEKDVVRGLESGANDYMVKPFKPDELRVRVRKLLKGRA